MELSLLFDIFLAFVKIKTKIKNLIFNTPTFLHTCAPSSKLPSSISAMSSAEVEINKKQVQREDCARDYLTFILTLQERPGLPNAGEPAGLSNLPNFTAKNQLLAFLSFDFNHLANDILTDNYFLNLSFD